MAQMHIPSSALAEQLWYHGTFTNILDARGESVRNREIIAAAENKELSVDSTE